MYSNVLTLTHYSVAWLFQNRFIRPLKKIVKMYKYFSIVNILIDVL